MREKEQKNKARMTSKKKLMKFLLSAGRRQFFLQFGTFSQAKIALLKC